MTFSSIMMTLWTNGDCYRDETYCIDFTLQLSDTGAIKELVVALMQMLVRYFITYCTKHFNVLYYMVYTGWYKQTGNIKWTKWISLIWFPHIFCLISFYQAEFEFLFLIRDLWCLLLRLLNEQNPPDNL